MRSPTMQMAYIGLPPIQKVCFVSWAFDLAHSTDSLRHMQQLLAEKPYSAAFVCQAATME